MDMAQPAHVMSQCRRTISEPGGFQEIDVAANGVQFQRGLSMAEFVERYGSDERCEAALIASRWPDGFVCPSCAVQGRSCTFRRGTRLYVQCSECRYQCSATSGTIFESTKLGLSRWFLAMQLLTQTKTNIAALELMRHLGVSYKTAWLVKHKLMEVMRQRETSRRLHGRIEVDDAYLGGERTGGKRGRGAQGKVSFVAAVQTTPEGRPQFACLNVQPFSLRAVEAFAKRAIAPNAHVVSDGLSCFAAFAEADVRHQRILTGGRKASMRLVPFRAVNTFLGNLKRSLDGTYHSFGFAKYAPRYLAETQYRFNRRFDLRSMLPRLLRAAGQTSPTPLKRIRVAEACP
jgi:ribosomal protein L37AE/L43A